MAKIFFSRGIDKYDNRPDQRSSADFNIFVDVIDRDRSPQKGLTYICAALGIGVHYQQPQKYHGIDHWRLKNHALDRCFLAFDFDGFASPEVFEEVCQYFQKWNCLIYTTASHSELAPRARAIVELDRTVSYVEGVELGMAAQRMLESVFGVGSIKFDDSVYRATQPLFTPVTSSISTRCLGQPMEVDRVINTYPVQVSAQISNVVTNVDTNITSKIFQWPSGFIQKGNRNPTMLRYAGHLRKRGHTEEEILALALAMNVQRFDPALSDEEVADICDRYSHQNSSSISTQFIEIDTGGVFAESAGAFHVPVTPPPKREYVFAGQVTAGTLNVIGGQGGVSKTMLVMQACVAAAVGGSIGNLSISAGASLLFLGEEDEAERDRRMGAICQHFNADRTLVEKRVKCYGAAGIDIRLTQKIESNAQATQMGDEVIRIALAHSVDSGAPLKIIVFDHSRLVLGGDPNSAEDVTQLTRILTKIARATGAAVILLAHSPKSVATKAGNEISSTDIAGSSAFVDNARAAYMMWTMREEEAKSHHVPELDRMKYVRLENVKANYAQTGGGYWFKRKFMQDWDVAVLEQVALYSPSIFEAKGTHALRDRILSELRKKPGGITERHLRDMSGKNGLLKASDASVRKEVQSMLEDALIDRRKPTDAERRQFKLGGGVREILASLSE